MQGRWTLLSCWQGCKTLRPLAETYFYKVKIHLPCDLVLTHEQWGHSPKTSPRCSQQLTPDNPNVEAPGLLQQIKKSQFTQTGEHPSAGKRDKLLIHIEKQRKQQRKVSKTLHWAEGGRQKRLHIGWFYLKFGQGRTNLQWWAAGRRVHGPEVCKL